MFYVDVPKLKGKIVECGYNNSSFSKACGVDRNTLASYLKNPEKTPYNVIDKMADLLCNDSKEANIIFFASKLS